MASFARLCLLERLSRAGWLRVFLFLALLAAGALSPAAVRADPGLSEDDGDMSLDEGLLSPSLTSVLEPVSDTVDVITQPLSPSGEAGIETDSTPATEATTGIQEPVIDASLPGNETGISTLSNDPSSGADASYTDPDSATVDTTPVSIPAPVATLTKSVAAVMDNGGQVPEANASQPATDGWVGDAAPLQAPTDIPELAAGLPTENPAPLADPLQPVTEPLDELLEPALKPTTETLEPGAAPVTATMLQEVTEAPDQSLKTATEPLVDLLEPTTIPMTDAPRPIAEPRTAALQPVDEAVQQVLQPVSEPLVELLVPTTELMGTALEPVIEPVTETLQPVTEAVVLVAQPVTEPALELLVPTTELVETALQPLTEPVMTTLQPVTEAVVVVAQPITEPVLELLEPAIDLAGTTLEPVIEPVTETLQPVTEAVVLVAQPVTEPMVELLEPAIDLVGTALEPVIEPVTATLQPVTEAVAPVLQPVTDPVLDLLVPATGSPAEVPDRSGTTVIPENQNSLEGDHVLVPAHQTGEQPVQVTMPSAAMQKDPGVSGTGATVISVPATPVNVGVSEEPPTLAGELQGQGSAVSGPSSAITESQVRDASRLPVLGSFGSAHDVPLGLGPSSSLPEVGLVLRLVGVPFFDEWNQSQGEQGFYSSDTPSPLAMSPAGEHQATSTSRVLDWGWRVERAAASDALHPALQGTDAPAFGAGVPKGESVALLLLMALPLWCLWQALDFIKERLRYATFNLVPLEPPR